MFFLADFAPVPRTKMGSQLPTIALRRLILVPIGGLANRLQAIASGRRLCSGIKAECIVGWDWGKFDRYFSVPPDATVVYDIKGLNPDRVVRHYLDPRNKRTVDTTVETLLLFSNCWFCGSHEKWPADRPGFLNELKAYLPAPAPALQAAIDDFSARHLADAAGFHIRRTDHQAARINSPDELFLAAAGGAIGRGERIFLATDNTETEHIFRKSFGDAIVTYPKLSPMKERWPRKFDATATEEDIVDFFLLAKTKYIVGSFGSTYSETAILINGSPKCLVVRRDDRRISRRIGRVLRAAGPWGEALADRHWHIELRRLAHGLSYAKRRLLDRPKPPRSS